MARRPGERPVRLAGGNAINILHRAQKRAGLLRGSGNVYRDLGHANADVKQFKALLAAEILKTLDREQLSVRQADRTHVATA